MTFLHPLGLLGLIGVPVLIIIYILKNRYTEQTIASTYMWRLSERFLKKRNPLARLAGIISLLLQILFVVSVSLAIARPVIILEGAAEEYCFVLDGSASMNMQKDGKTRLDRAKSEIARIVEDAKPGSAFSLVYVTNSTETVFELEEDRELVLSRLDLLDASDTSIDFTDSIGVAQALFNENPSVITYLFTDADCKEHTNVRVVDVSSEEVNISVYGVTYIEAGLGAYTVTGTAVAYGGDATTNIEVRNNLEDRALGTLSLQLKADVPEDFSISIESESFYSLKVTSAASDALAEDNTAIVYNIKKENSAKALLVSDTPFLLEKAISVAGNVEIAVMSTKDYKTLEKELIAADSGVTGYGLYIYDAYSPEALPEDGAVWLVGAPENTHGAGFSIQGTLELDDGAELELNKSSNSLVKRLTTGLSGDGIYVKKLTKCGLYGDFKTIFSYMGNPVIFTGETDAGNREVVFAFNLHDTNFALSSDYPALLHNLLSYSFPDVIEKTEYYCGENAEINTPTGCTGIRVTPPSGNYFYAEVGSAVSEFLLSEAGEYKITLELAAGEREFFIYSAVPTAERATQAQSIDSYGIRGEAENNGRDGTYDPIVLIFLLAAIFFTAEWMVYCYEKYQLR